ncbi:MAG TPA: ABC transporter ATP-binding protein [Acidimicrobiales bacterium]|nr:ABC transporter ATP-binding protein [Acidimicrobiales bacterium]
MRRPSFPAVGGAPLLVATDVRTWFDTPRGTLRAVDSVSLRLERGRTLGIVGESGSGKTVLARSLLNLVFSRNAQQDGSVRYRGVELRGRSVRDMTHVWGQELAMVFQDPMTSLNPTLKIGEQLKESLWYHLGLRRHALHDTSVNLLRSVGIPEPERRMRDYPHALSGGMRQRVTIAIALACGPQLLVADEPTTALDVTVQRQILDLLQTQQRERSMGMILVTHDLGVVAGRTDEIAVMYAGHIVEQAPTRTLFHQRRHPYTDGLLRSIPRLANEPHTELAAIPGRPPDLIELGPGCPFAPRCPRATPVCLDVRPGLEQVGTGHAVACFNPVESIVRVAS